MLGQVVGKYRLVEAIGEGGMGQVFLGKHELLGRTAAIKLLSPEISERTDVLQRFFREAVVTSQVKHPGIVEVYDYGHGESGVAFLVMELLEGETLHERLSINGRMTIPKAVTLAKQMAGALAAAHDLGVIHRDLKPSNVFLVKDDIIDHGERVKILDFGIAKLMQKDPTSVDLTASGAIVGTPVFMAPEQCRGETDLLPEADIYSFGCLLYSMLVGRPPFICKTSGEYIVAHCTGDYPRPSMYVELPEKLEQLVTSMLEKDALQRPSADEVRRRLDALVIDAKLYPAMKVDSDDGDTTIDNATSYGTLSSNGIGYSEKAPLGTPAPGNPDSKIGAEVFGTNPPTSALTVALQSSPDQKVTTPIGTVAPTGESYPRPLGTIESVAPREVSVASMASRNVAVPAKTALDRALRPRSAMASSQKRRTMLIISGASVVAIGLVALLAATGGGEGEQRNDDQTAVTAVIDAGVVSQAPPEPPEPTVQIDASVRVSVAPVAPDAAVPAKPDAGSSVIAEVTFQVQSSPSGATVRTSRKGSPIGKTPLPITRAANSSANKRVIWLSKRGYQTKKHVLQDPERPVSISLRKKKPRGPSGGDPMDEM